MPPTIAFFTDPALAAASPRIRYVLDVLERHPTAPEGIVWLLNPADASPDSVRCYYGAKENVPSNAVFTPAQRHFFLSKPYENQSVMLAPFLFGETTQYAVVPNDTPTAAPFFSDRSFGFDWLETLFFHFSRWEEYAPDNTAIDEIGIMKSDAQLLVRHRVHHVPVADRLIAAVYEALGFSPDVQPTVFSISHDVDDLAVFGPEFYLPRYLAGVALRHRTLRRWPRIISDFWQVRTGRKTDPGDTFDWLLHLWPGVEKTIYFGMGNNSVYDHFPDLNTPRLLEIRDLAQKAGYQTGIHPGFNTWKDAALLRQEVERAGAWLGTPVIRSRQHYLHFSFPETADVLESAGIQEDATLGFRDRIGFRAGTGFPFHLYCFQEERPYRWVEKPLIAMDCGLVREGKTRPSEIRHVWNSFISRNKTGTAISLSLHNTYVYEQALHGIDFGALFGSLFRNSQHVHRHV